MRRRLRLGRRVLTIVCYIMVLGFLELSSSGAAEEQTVQQMSANGSRSLRPFTVKDHWEIRWDTADGLVVFVMRADADPKDPLIKVPIASATQRTAGKGSTYVEPGGRYYLQITGFGDWSISVVQLP